MSIFEPWVGKRVGPFTPPNFPNLNRQQFQAEQESLVSEEQESEQSGTVRQKPTPASTGAPTPGYRQRTNITPQSTGAPMPKSKIKSLPAKHTSQYPKKIKGTAPGTKPKKR